MVVDHLALAFNASDGSFSAGQGHEACWSNPMQMTGQVERKKGGQVCAITQVGDLWKVSAAFGSLGFFASSFAGSDENFDKPGNCMSRGRSRELMRITIRVRDEMSVTAVWNECSQQSEHFPQRTPVRLPIIGIRHLESWGGGCGRFGIF